MNPQERRLLELVETEFDLPRHLISLQTPIVEIGDSLDWFQLLFAVEEAFQVQLTPAQSAQVRTVADLLALLPQPCEA